VITPLHPTLRMEGDGIQTHHVRVPKVRRVSTSARSIIQDYLNMVDWRHIQTECPQGVTEDWYTSPSFIQWQEQQTTRVIPAPEVGELVRSLIYQPPVQSLTEGVEEIKELLKEGTPTSSWIRTGNPRGRTMGGGTIPTGTYTSAPRAPTGMGPTKPPSPRSTVTSVRENDSRLVPVPHSARPEMQMSMPSGGHLSRMRITEMRHADVRGFL
jgi:hypothetical protein